MIKEKQTDEIAELLLECADAANMRMMIADVESHRVGKLEFQLLIQRQEKEEGGSIEK